MFSPSEYPSCRMPPRKLSRSRRYAASEPAMSTAIRGRLSAGCCARAARGHAAAPPSSPMNTRLLSSNIELLLDLLPSGDEELGPAPTLPNHTIPHQGYAGGGATA